MQRNELINSDEIAIDIDERSPLLAKARQDTENTIEKLAAQIKRQEQDKLNQEQMNKHIDKALTAFSSMKEVEALIAFLDNHPEIKTLDLSHSLKANMKRSHHDPYRMRNGWNKIFNNDDAPLKRGGLQLIAFTVAIILFPITITVAMIASFFLLTTSLLEKIFGDFSKRDVGLAVTKRLAMVIERNKTITSLKIHGHGPRRFPYGQYTDDRHETILTNAILKNDTLLSADTFETSSTTVDPAIAKHLAKNKFSRITQSLLAFYTGHYQDESNVSKIAPDNIKTISNMVLESSLPKNASTFFKVEEIPGKIVKTVDDIVEARHPHR